MENEPLREGGRRPASPGGGRAAQSISTRRAYGVQRICRVWGPASTRDGTRRGRAHAPRAGRSPDAVWSATSAGCSKPHRFMARGTGKRGRSCRVRRLMREHDLQAPHRVGLALVGARCDVGNGHDGHTIGEGSAFVFGRSITVTECISSMQRAGAGSRPWSRWPANASAPSKVAHRLRHDHGSNYLADDGGRVFGIESSSCGSPKATASLSGTLKVSGCFDTKELAWPCSSSSGRTTSTGWRDTTKPRCDATSRAGRGRVDANTVKPLSKNPEAVQVMPTSGASGTPESGCCVSPSF